jgi:hypothetical protein
VIHAQRAQARELLVHGTVGVMNPSIEVDLQHWGVNVPFDFGDGGRGGEPDEKLSVHAGRVREGCL